MKNIIEKIEHFLEVELANDPSGHSVDHALRVFRLATYIQKQEGGNERTILIAALVHDVIDEKLFTDVLAQKQKLYNYLKSIGCDEAELIDIFYIIENMSFKGGHNKALQTLEAKIVQDADRLDAMGAIGIGRTFMYGGSRHTKMYDECMKPVTFENEAAYRTNKGTILNHFDEKLLKLKDLMNTDTGKILAQERHEFMELFVKQFLKEYHMS